MKASTSGKPAKETFAKPANRLVLPQIAALASRPSVPSSGKSPLDFVGLSAKETSLDTKRPSSSISKRSDGPTNELQERLAKSDNGSERETRTSSLEKPSEPKSGSSIAKEDDGTDDDGRSGSHSDVSNKAASLGSKSVNSGATFALDEKESLRPDDSASVKAAEDDDRLSGIGSATGTSRVGSEAGARAFRDQFHEISERMGYSPQHGAAAAPFATSSQDETVPLSRPEADAVDLSSTPNVAGAGAGVASVPFGFVQGGPDEKLLEALESPKDRLFLLRLEQDLIDFVKNSKEPLLDVPPCNSFCRLLAHKLADYYLLSHFVDASTTSVRIYRTPFCRLPPPLTGISNPPTSSSTPPPNGPSMKIMRRETSGLQSQTSPEKSTASSSEGPSKAASITSGDVDRDVEALGANMEQTLELVSIKDKANLTREEREAKYKEARERIFKGFEESSEQEEESTVNEDGKETSRSSSSADRGKPIGRKQRKTGDDGFEARSQFAQYYPPPQPQPQQQYPTNALSAMTPYPPFQAPPAAFGDASGNPHVSGPADNTNGFQANLTSNLAQPYPVPTAGYPPPPFSGVSGPNFPQMMLPSFNGGQAAAGFPPSNPPSQFGHLGVPHNINGPGPQYGPQTQPVNPQWPSTYPGMHLSHPQYPGQGTPLPPNHQHPSPATGGPGSPYPFGQLPNQQFRTPLNPQHPIPGSFNRRAFNPQTQSFIPGGRNMGPPGALGPANPSMEPSSYYGPQFGGMPLGFNAAQTQQQQMQRSFAPFGSPHTSRSSSAKQSPNAKMPNGSSSQSNMASGGSQSVPNTLAKWGTPPTLPPKPPAPVSATVPKENARPGLGKSYSNALQQERRVGAANTSASQPASVPVLSPIGIPASAQ
ncbi:MAG: hypothetical protein M1825_000838 [Sarcosagium campestre]|nr:MAG: hypothetical protein M1825_000838 [Sarcosagium campestre]